MQSSANTHHMLLTSTWNTHPSSLSPCLIMTTAVYLIAASNRPLNMLTPLRISEWSIYDKHINTRSRHRWSNERSRRLIIHQTGDIILYNQTVLRTTSNAAKAITIYAPADIGRCVLIISICSTRRRRRRQPPTSGVGGYFAR